MSDLSDRLLELAINFIKKQAFDSAQLTLQEALKLRPHDTDMWVLRGNCLCALDRYFDAILNYDRAIGFKDDLRDAWSNRGEAFAKIGMWGEAERSFRRSIEIRDTAEPHVGLANMFSTLGRLEDAEVESRAAIVLDNTAANHYLLGVILLGMGRWHEGFPEYQYRWMDNPAPPRALSRIEQWDGRPLTDSTIVLCPEQGYGDEIMAWRFADRYLLGAKKVILQSRSPLLDLARTVPHVDEVIDIRDEPHADYSCALLDIPWKVGLAAPYRIPTPDRYVWPPHPMRVSYWKDKVARLGGGLNVGICWSSGSSFGVTTAGQRMKSIPLSMFKAFDVPGVNLVSLQKPKCQVKADFPLADWMDEVDDFSDTAALIENLDLVITVDTAVAHLAGAMSKPVWNFVRFSPLFPWLGPGDRPRSSIWYPKNMTLYRQPRLGDWESPVAEAVTDLQHLVDLE